MRGDSKMMEIERIPISEILREAFNLSDNEAALKSDGAGQSPLDE